MEICIVEAPAPEESKGEKNGMPPEQDDNPPASVSVEHTENTPEVCNRLHCKVTILPSLFVTLKIRLFLVGCRSLFIIRPEQDDNPPASVSVEHTENTPEAEGPDFEAAIAEAEQRGYLRGRNERFILLITRFGVKCATFHIQFYCKFWNQKVYVVSLISTGH